jgi:biopolymer transport protein ExbD
MGAKLASGGGRGGVTPDINVTPLVDVVLVLLIIFMVIIPNVQDGKAIEIIKVPKADENADSVEPLVVTIDRNEVFTLGEDDMSRAAVLQGLAAEYAEDPGQRVLLRADATLPYKTVREFFADTQEVGFVHIALAVGVAAEWSEEEGGDG